MVKSKTFLAVLSAVWLFAVRVAAAASLTVSPSVSDGFSRIEFKWEYPTEYRVSKSDGRLDVFFSREIDADVGVIRRALPSSVRSVSEGRDKKSLSLILSRPFLIRDFGTEKSLTVDLLGTDDPKIPVPSRVSAERYVSATPSAVRAAPAAPSPVVRRSASLRPLSLFAVQRPEHDQIVFVWNKKTPFSQKTENGAYEISFNTPLSADSVDLRQVMSVLPKEMQNWRFSSRNGKLSLNVPLPNGYAASAEERGRQVYLTLTRPAERPSVFQTKKKPAVAEPAPVERKEALKPPPVSVPLPAEDKPSVPEEGAEAPPYSAEQETVRLVNVSDPLGFSEKEKTEEETLSSPAASGYRSVTLSFSWPRMTGVAAFRRDGYLWVVFDRKSEFHFDTELELNKDIIHEMVQIPHSHATILRFVTAEGYNPSFRREGLLWILDLMYQPLRPRRNIELVLQRKTPFGPRIFIPLDEMPQVIPLIDPEVGDLIYIVPVFALGKGLPHSRSFVDASFLQTAQGIVVVPNIEDLNVYASTAGVEVRGPKGGMRFSSEDVLAYMAKSSVTKNPLAQILDVGVWGGDAPNYAEALRMKQADVVSASENEKPLARLALARFYFANGMFPETLGVLRVLTADAPAYAKEPAVLALRGAANFMMMRYGEAMKDFASPELGGNNAVDFWRAATLAATSVTPERYLAPMKNNMGILQAYPQSVKTRLALAGLHSAVAGGDGFAVQNFMEAAFNPQNTNAENSEITFYHALWQENSGMYNQAVKEMTVLADGKDYYFRAMGGLEKIRMQTRMDELTPDQRIAELEKLMYAWRGDAFEYNLMTMLVAAYQDQKDYSKVLHLLKDMQIRFRDMPESKGIPPLMEDIFQRLYLNDDEELLSPVKAIALYNEFSDLTPSGEKGARIVRRLADRLVAIDLLEPAASLLEKEVVKPIGAKEKGLIYTRLALIRLLNKEPEKALKAVSESDKLPFSDKVAAQRKYIKAKALADSGKTGEAGALLEGDEAPEAKMLRAEIYWQAKDWGKAADAMKYLVSRPTPGVPLTPEEARRVLNWATALRLAGRAKVVIRLRENFLPYMKDTALAQPFDFITQAPQQGLMDYRTVSKEIEAAENFHSFAKDYIDILKTQGLSKAVQ